MAEEAEVIVIGSGFGGATAAAKLAEAGVRVTVLERGPWRDTLPTRSMGIRERSTFPRGLAMYTRTLRHISGSQPFSWRIGFSNKGLFELYYGDGVTVVASSNVGGGSHIYSAVHTRPATENYWDGHVDDVSSKEMERHYIAVIERLGSVVPTAEHRMPNTTAQRFGHDSVLEPAMPYPGARLGYLLPADPDNPKEIETRDGVKRREVDYRANDDGFFGSPEGGKTTLDVAYLWPAMKTGNLAVQDMTEVIEIRSLSTGAGARYEVKFRDLKRKELRTIRSNNVVVAAGTLNTLKLLMQSRHAGGIRGLPYLGRCFGTNGDLLGFWDRCSQQDLTSGLPSRGGFRLRGIEGSPVFGGGAPSSSPSYPLPGWLKRRIGRSQMFYGMGADSMDGLASFDGGRFRLRFNTSGSPIFEELWSATQAVSDRTGKQVYFRRKATTVHPMGGAGLGRDESTGVIDGDGQVFGNPGLYVTDAAAFPTSVGAPPSLSIAAWAEHVVDRFVGSSR